jgi:hypothetical protein
MSRSPFTQPWALLARGSVAAGIAAAVAAFALASGNPPAIVRVSTCVHVSGETAHYCGPATARISVFRHAVFRHGACTRKRVGDVTLLQVRIGARSLDGNSTNAGLTFFSLGMTGSPSQPERGNVVAYYRSKRWLGRGVTAKRDARGGTFLARGIAGSRGRATASFRC